MRHLLTLGLLLSSVVFHSGCSAEVHCVSDNGEDSGIAEAPDAGPGFGPDATTPTDKGHGSDLEPNGASNEIRNITGLDWTIAGSAAYLQPITYWEADHELWTTNVMAVVFADGPLRCSNLGPARSEKTFVEDLPPAALLSLSKNLLVLFYRSSQWPALDRTPLESHGFLCRDGTCSEISTGEAELANPKGNWATDPWIWGDFDLEESAPTGANPATRIEGYFALQNCEPTF